MLWASVDERSRTFGVFRRMVRSWIDSNRLICGDGWHPFTLSRRIVNWIHASSFFAAELLDDGVFRDEFVAALYGQARILASDLEFDVDGNHLLENIRALIWAGLAFDGSEPRSWLEKGERLLEKELPAQLLEDGGHLERTPGYHLAILKNYLELAFFLRTRQKHIEPLDSSLRQMLTFTVRFFPKSSRIPLLKDSTVEDSYQPSDLLAIGAVYFDDSDYKVSQELGLLPLLILNRDDLGQFRALPSRVTESKSTFFKASGYGVFRSRPGNYLVFDFGQPCPDHLPAHAHADLLSFELFLGGEPVIVDSGVYAYEEGPWRDHFRSTRAHNTVEIEGRNQSEVWASFRVGRRARPTVSGWEDNQRYTFAQASHDGYKKLPGKVVHRRTILYDKELDFWLVVDQLFGRGRVTAHSYVHLHPGVEVQESGEVWEIGHPQGGVHLAVFGAQEVVSSCGRLQPVRQGWYSERFGEMQPSLVISLEAPKPLPGILGYLIANSKPEMLTCESGRDFEEISIGIEDAARRVNIPLEGRVLLTPF